MPKRKPAHNRKFHSGDKVWYVAEATAPDGAVVSVRQYGIVAGMVDRGTKGDRQYVVLRTYDTGNNYVYGGGVYVDSWRLFPDEDSQWSRNQKKPRVYRANQRLGQMHERGCVCNCCVHVPYRPGDVRQDGTFAWEAE